MMSEVKETTRRVETRSAQALSELVEDFENLARTMRQSPAADGPDGAVVVREAPLSGFRNSVATAAMSYEPDLPSRNGRFLDQVHNLRCTETVYAGEDSVALTQQWSFHREGSLEHFCLIRQFSEIAYEKTQITYDPFGMRLRGQVSRTGF